MTASRQRSSASEASNDDAFRQRYAAFIGQIQLHAVWLSSTRVTNHFGPHGPQADERIDFHIESDANWVGVESGFDAFHSYRVTITVEDEGAAEIEIEFGLHFHSDDPMTDEIFKTFSDVNLPVNSWPFLREYLSTTTGRMGWLPYTLPALKRGVPPPPPRPRTAARTRRARPADEDKKATS